MALADSALSFSLLQSPLQCLFRPYDRRSVLLLFVFFFSSFSLFSSSSLPLSFPFTSWVGLGFRAACRSSSTSSLRSPPSCPSSSASPSRSVGRWVSAAIFLVLVLFVDEGGGGDEDPLSFFLSFFLSVFLCVTYSSSPCSVPVSVPNSTGKTRFSPTIIGDDEGGSGGVGLCMVVEVSQVCMGGWVCERGQPNKWMDLFLFPPLSLCLSLFSRRFHLPFGSRCVQLCMCA